MTNQELEAEVNKFIIAATKMLGPIPPQTLNLVKEIYRSGYITGRITRMTEEISRADIPIERTGKMIEEIVRLSFSGVTSVSTMSPEDIKRTTDAAISKAKGTTS